MSGCGSRECWRCRLPVFLSPPLPQRTTDEGERWTYEEIAEIGQAVRRGARAVTSDAV